MMLAKKTEVVVRTRKYFTSRFLLKHNFYFGTRGTRGKSERHSCVSNPTVSPSSTPAGAAVQAERQTRESQEKQGQEKQSSEIEISPSSSSSRNALPIISWDFLSIFHSPPIHCTWRKKQKSPSHDLANILVAEQISSTKEE